MARIRTIKPEFWTDEKVVTLPFVARLLFIGLWNFADDSGAVDFSPTRLRMQIFPGEAAIDVSALLDLLAVAGLVDVLIGPEGSRALVVANWEKHQKIDNPSKRVLSRENYRVHAISDEARMKAARDHGCEPGQEVVATCAACGSPGRIYWHRAQDGRPTRWVYFGDLEVSTRQTHDGMNVEVIENTNLTCYACASRHPRVPIDRHDRVLDPRGVIASPREGSTLEGKGMEGKGARDRAVGQEGRAPALAHGAGSAPSVGAHPAPRLGPRRAHTILTPPRDLTAFWEGPIFNLPGKWAAKVLRAANGGLTEDDLSAFARSLTARLEQAEGEAPSEGFLGWLDVELTAWRATRTSTQASQRASESAQRFIENQTEIWPARTPEENKALLRSAMGVRRG
jgi:hypothetical protein